MRIFQENYHTHTFRCHHAAGDSLEYALAAKKAGKRKNKRKIPFVLFGKLWYIVMALYNKKAW